MTYETQSGSSVSTVLIVDDDTSICQILHKILLGEGYRILEAYNGKEALHLFHIHSIDVVLQDLSMPDMNGIEVAALMIAKKPSIPVILISAYGTIAKAVEATKAGIYDFLEKPLDRDRILITVRNAVIQNTLHDQLLHYRHETLERFKMVGDSPVMKRVFHLIEKVSPFQSPVLVCGENGSGKELVAKAIHHNSKRNLKPLVKINCAAIPDALIESELFGYVKGAFTGAHVSKTGRLEIANNGTIFLDEVGDLSPMAQAKMLRFLENGEIQRVGSITTSTVDVRIIAATNKDLPLMVKEESFREDLYYRLNAFPIQLPPLRDHKEDIPQLLDYFLTEFADANGVIKPQLSSAATVYLCNYSWPGNIRQLRSIVERLMIMKDGDVIDLSLVQMFLKDADTPLHEKPERQTASLQDARQSFERDYIIEILDASDWRVANAAQILGIDRANLYRKMRQLGIDGDKR
jgi:two-component system, NtrC family, nitrogen regulation response regulator NtrX